MRSWLSNLCFQIVRYYLIYNNFYKYYSPTDYCTKINLVEISPASRQAGICSNTGLPDLTRQALLLIRRCVDLTRNSAGLYKISKNCTCSDNFLKLKR